VLFLHIRLSELANLLQLFANNTTKNGSSEKHLRIEKTVPVGFFAELTYFTFDKWRVYDTKVTTYVPLIVLQVLRLLPREVPEFLMNSERTYWWLGSAGKCLRTSSIDIGYL
jgi:hypothetical protein